MQPRPNWKSHLQPYVQLPTSCTAALPSCIPTKCNIHLLDEVNGRLEVETKVNELPLDVFPLVLFLLDDEHCVVEQLLQLFICVVDAQLLKWVHLSRQQQHLTVSQLTQQTLTSCCSNGNKITSLLSPCKQRWVISTTGKPGHTQLCPPQVLLPVKESGPPSNTGFSGLLHAYNTNTISISSAFFDVFTNVFDTETNRQTDKSRIKQQATPYGIHSNSANR